MQHINAQTKTKYNVITRYKNNRDREYIYTKYFTSETNAVSYCRYRLDNPKIFSCVVEVAPKAVKAVKAAPKAALQAIKGKPFFFRDNAGYKYYINKGEKIKSPKPVFEPIITY
jgi:hypothetical protein